MEKLIIIGNGFDIWQGLKTSYKYLVEYYRDNRERILKKLHIPEVVYEDEDGTKFHTDQTSIIYSNPFFSEILDDEFWFNFEESLGVIDDQTVNLYFGKTRRELRYMNKTIKRAKRIIHYTFMEWLKTIALPNIKIDDYNFDNCLFVNFNYTPTLQQIFNVREENVLHIHGELNDKKSIIYGHNSHPEPPERIAKFFGGRFKGLYQIEKLLYDTNKPIDEQIALCIFFFSLHAIPVKSLEEIVVLGHSFGEVDFEYFRFFKRALKNNAKWKITFHTPEDVIRIKKVLKKLKIKNYQLYSSIDECLEEFKK